MYRPRRASHTFIHPTEPYHVHERYHFRAIEVLIDILGVPRARRDGGWGGGEGRQRALLPGRKGPFWGESASLSPTIPPPMPTNVLSKRPVMTLIPTKRHTRVFVGPRAVPPSLSPSLPPSLSPLPSLSLSSFPLPLPLFPHLLLSSPLPLLSSLSSLLSSRLSPLSRLSRLSRLSSPTPPHPFPSPTPHPPTAGQDDLPRPHRRGDRGGAPGRVL